ncbi:MAG: hypothetical protein NVV74_07020 [Magnetospirillum sp.]|nr:hypothetical protein [Magnetospirillum sp.]
MADIIELDRAAPAPRERTSCDSIAALNRHTRACAFAKADITVLAKRLQEMGRPAPAAADPHDAAALKVEKNALALVFIPAVMTVAEDLAALHPDSLFTLLLGQLGMIPAAEVRAATDRRNPQAFICGQVYASLRNLFEHVATAYVALAVRSADQGDAEMEWVVENLLRRYQQALSGYHAHTAVASTHFTPAGHILAGINTALFFILRALSALTVLGGERLGRPLTRDDLAQGMGNSTPLLLTIARCHLEQLLALEGPLGKHADLFMARLDQPDYRDALAAMFVVELGGNGLRLEIQPGVLAGLPVMSSPKPRTGCPALYAATMDNVNAIVALARLTEQAFANLALAA